MKTVPWALSDQRYCISIKDVHSFFRFEGYNTFLEAIFFSKNLLPFQILSYIYIYTIDKPVRQRYIIINQPLAYATLHITYERTWLEVMLRWTHDQPMKTPSCIKLLHHKHESFSDMLIFLKIYLYTKDHLDMTFIRVLSDCDCHMVITDLSQSVLQGNRW